MVLKKALWLLFTFYVVCESGFVDNLGKCNINHGECQKDLIQSALKNISRNGIPELGIPILDPMKLSDITVSVLNSFDITLVEGTVKGLKNCVIEKMVTNIKKEHATMDVTCDLSIKGHYKVQASSPIIKDLFGAQSVRGDGNGRVKIEKIRMKFDFYFYIQKRNEELYVKCKANKIFYSYNVEKITFAADNLYLGDQESSKFVIRLLNENWRVIIEAFGKPFFDKAMEFMYIYVHKFVDEVPAKNYLSDDFSIYAKD